MEAPWSRHDWFNHCPLVIDATSSPSLLPRGRGCGWKLQPSNHTVGSPANQPHPRWGPKVILLNWRVLVALPETKTKTKYIFLVINHNITASHWDTWELHVSLLCPWQSFVTCFSVWHIVEKALKPSIRSPELESYSSTRYKLCDLGPSTQSLEIQFLRL